ncbi:MAG: hypothetical protein LBR36_01765, partial [Bacteroidales bacterium]|nr:hypothetical protein [Bacteroidales bacterium]
YKDSLYIINAPLKQLVETPSNKDSIARLKKEISRQQSAFIDRHPAWMLGAMFGSPVAISGLPTEIEISKSTVKTFNAKGKVQRRFHYTYQKVNDNLYYLVTKKETL